MNEKGLASLDGYNEVGGGKTHFLFLDFNEGEYELQARQVDGTAGFVTPLIRKASTHDHSFVARLAGLMIGQDFGLIATFDPAGAGEKVFIKMKAAELGPIDKWLKTGEVFAVVAIQRRLPAQPNTKGPTKTKAVQIGKRIDDVLLRVVGEPRDGVIPCQIFYRREVPLPTRGVLGFRCVKLGTTTGPLRLKLVDAAGIPQKGASLQVYAHANGFPQGDKEADSTVNRDGVFVSKEQFANVAFVRVLLGNRQLARIPIELQGDRIEVRTITLDPDAERHDQLDAERRDLLTRITDGRLTQVHCFQEIMALEQAGKKTDALSRGESVLKLLDAAAVELQDDIGKLKIQTKELAPKTDGYANDCEQQLQILRGKQEELRQHLAKLKESIVEDNNPLVQAKKKKIQDLIREAELFVTQAEYDQALAKYKDAVAEVQDEPAAKQRIESAYQSLKKAWALTPGDQAHAEARTFIMDFWPKLSTAKDVRDQLPEARKAFEKCKAVGDRLALNKMHQASVEVTTKFVDELKKLSEGAMEEEDKNTLEIYQKVNEDYSKLLKDVENYLVKEEKK